MTPDPETAPLPGFTGETETMPAVPEPEPDLRASFAGTSVIGLPEKRPFPLSPIGDALVSSLPGFDILPCGHCGAVFADAPPDVLTVTRPLGALRHLAYEAGWQYDLTLTWTCPDCSAAMAAAEAEAYAQLASESYPDILRESDIKTRATMTANGRYQWDYDDWRERYRPRPEECEPEPATDGEVAA